MPRYATAPGQNVGYAHQGPEPGYAPQPGYNPQQATYAPLRAPYLCTRDELRPGYRRTTRRKVETRASHSRPLPLGRVGLF